MLTLIICDSRGTGLLPLLKQTKDLGDLRITISRGAGSLRATQHASMEIQTCKPDLVILMTGICDITTRNNISRITTLPCLSQEELVNGATGGIKLAVALIKQLGCDRVSVATVTGIDLDDYNNRERKHMDQQQYETYRRTVKTVNPNQELLDTVVLLVNKEIVALNRKNKLPTTWTANAIHAYFKKAYHHYYKHLQDGCHATQRTKQYWANQLARTIRIIKLRINESNQ